MLGRVWTWHKCRTIKQLCELIMWQLSSESRELQKQTFARTRSWDCNQPTILDKSPWDSTSIFIFFCHFSVPSYSTSFSKISCSSLTPHPPPPPPYTKLKLEKNSGYTRPTLGWGEELDLCEMENTPEMQKCPKIDDCLKKTEVERKKAILRGFQAFKSVFSGFWWKIASEQTFSHLFKVFWTCFKNSLETNDIHQKLRYLIAAVLYSKG